MNYRKTANHPQNTLLTSATFPFELESSTTLPSESDTAASEQKY